MHGFKIKLFSFLLLLISLTELYGSDIWQNLNGKEWVLEEYFSVIRSHDRDTLIAKLPLIETNYYWTDEHAEDLVEYYWRDLYYIDFEIKFFEDKIYESYQEIKRSRCIHIGDLAEGFFTIQNLKSYDNIILLDVICDDIDDLNRFIIKLPEIEKNKDYVFMLKFDGDYLDFYIDDVFIHTFCRINEATLKEYENLIKNNTCDLSKVTWPRHADGTSDYDDKIIMPEPLIITGSTNPDESAAGKDNWIEKKLARESFVIYEDFEVLKAQNRDKLIELYPSVYHAPELSEVDFKTYLYWYTAVPNAFLEFKVNTDEEMKHKRLGNFYLAWNYSGETLSIFCFPYYMTVRNIIVKNNEIIFPLIGIIQKSDLYYSNFIKTEIPFKEYEYDIHSAKIIIDGDYLDFYIDDVFIHTFCKINEATLKEYENLIKNNTCDLSKVTWPRHADGTSDYDDKIIMPEPLISIGNTDIDKATAGKDKIQANIDESEKIKKVQVKSKNQIMAVKIPAVLRADPSIEKGTPMLKAATGSRVKIIKVGKKQTIDNIESNWVKVKFLDGAKKVTGKDISPDTVGWLFGGYLE